MSVTLRRLILAGLGLLAGMTTWPLTEIALANQTIFPSYFVFNLALGLLMGTIMGGYFGSGQGIGAGSTIRFTTGMIQGAVIGLFGGITGFLVGQYVLLILGNVFVSHSAFTNLGYPLSRAVGWSIVGLFIGAIEGIRSKSIRLIRVGMLGGWIGGLLGGLIMEYLHLYLNSIMIGRLVGIVILGLLIGFFYGLVENSLSFGTLKVLNGEFKGRDYLINFRRTRLGVGKKAHIRLEPYTAVAELHAEIRVHRGNLHLRSLSESHVVLVNDDPITEKELKYEDVIKIGQAKFILI